LSDLIETTHTVHYASYRARALRKPGRPESILPSDDSYDDKIGVATKEQREELLRREEQLRQSFMVQVREKEVYLKDKEEMVTIATY
jgi:septin family protein